MSLFGADGSRVFYIPAAADFANCFASGLIDRTHVEAPPEAMARVTVFTNTRRAARSLTQALRERLGPAGFSPEFRIIGELGLDPRFAANAGPVADPLIRRLRLARIVKEILDRAKGRLGPPSAALPLADLVSAMVDELQEHRADIDRLSAVAPDNHAAHWEISRLVLQTAQSEWRAWADAHLDGAPDPAERLDSSIDDLIRRWASDPPTHPVLAVGSTASRPGAARLLRAIARLPQGAVILPGFDPRLDEAARRNITAEHPQAAMLSFVESLDLSNDEIRPWRSLEKADRGLLHRTEVVAEALRPAPVTDAWRANRTRMAAIAPDATAGLSLIEAPDSRREAEAAALAIRETLAHPGLRVALVTPDRTLARRVAVELAGFHIEADDSGGRPLSLTPPGAFLGLLADWAAEIEDGRRAALRLLSLLKHPMCAAGAGRSAHLDGVRWMEIAALRRATPATGFEAIRAAVADWAAERKGRETRAEAALRVIGQTENTLAPLLALKGASASLSARAAAHRRAATMLSAAREPDGGQTALWSGADGEEALQALSALERAGDAFGEASAVEYARIQNAFLSDEAAREPVRVHPRVAIFGPLEARMQHADRVILAGLDEGVWPELRDLDPWFSRPMRRAAGLPDAERRIGLSAHDFSQGLGAPDVVLTRALKRDGAATVASRWLQRLTNLLQGAAPESLDAMRKRGDVYLCIARINKLSAAAASAPRPKPCPSVNARPRRLSVTRVETLIRDPYAIYAERILRLRAIDPIGRAPDARERGSVAHRAVELFVSGTRDGFPADPWPIWRKCVAEALRDVSVWPAARALWERRLARVAPWFLSGEEIRRQHGKPVGIEELGKLILPSLAGDFTLTAKADRIDRLLSGGYAVYDYKTGGVPSEPQVAAFAKQLPLEAAIVEAGGFDGIPPAPAELLSYLRLGGEGGEKRVDRKASASEQARESLAQLGRLIAAYDDPPTPYVSRARPERIVHSSDYDHLARVAEWSANGEGEAGS